MQKKVSLLVFYFILIIGINITNAQCKDSNGVFKCCDVFEDNTIAYLNNFNIKTKKRKSLKDENGKTWDIFLMQGTKYRFALCSYNGLDRIEMILYDKTKNADDAIASTFEAGKDRAYFDFSCKKSELYGVAIRFKNKDTIGEKICAIGLLGFIGRVK